jgi:hypothetical protein
VPSALVSELKRLGKEQKARMKHLFIIAAGTLWTGVALGITAAFGLPPEEAFQVVPGFLVAGVATSYSVTFLFRRYLVLPEARRKYWLPFATIATGVSIWSTLVFFAAAVSSLVGGRHDLFDGYGYFLITGLLITLTVALPITYPLAYATQLLIARYAAPKNA